MKLHEQWIQVRQVCASIYRHSDTWNIFRRRTNMIEYSALPRKLLIGINHRARNWEMDNAIWKQLCIVSCVDLNEKFQLRKCFFSADSNVKLFCFDKQKFSTFIIFHRNSDELRFE